MAAGQNIGLVGQTGNADGPHIHLQVKQGGKFVDPWSVIGQTQYPQAPPSMAPSPSVTQTPTPQAPTPQAPASPTSSAGLRKKMAAAEKVDSPTSSEGLRQAMGKGGR